MIENIKKLTSNLIDSGVLLNDTSEMFINELIMTLEFNEIDYEIVDYPYFITYKEVNGFISAFHRNAENKGSIFKNDLIDEMIEDLNRNEKLYIYKASVALMDGMEYFKIRSTQ